jgi:hypothetical protein
VVPRDSCAPSSRGFCAVDDETVSWIANVAVLFDCIVFVVPGRFGKGVYLFPRRLYGRSTTLHKE